MHRWQLAPATPVGPPRPQNHTQDRGRRRTFTTSLRRGRVRTGRFLFTSRSHRTCRRPRSRKQVLATSSNIPPEREVPAARPQRRITRLRQKRRRQATADKTIQRAIRSSATPFQGTSTSIGTKKGLDIDRPVQTSVPDERTTDNSTIQSRTAHCHGPSSPRGSTVPPHSYGFVASSQLTGRSIYQDLMGYTRQHVNNT